MIVFYMLCRMRRQIGCWCASRSSKPLCGVKSFTGGLDSDHLSFVNDAASIVKGEAVSQPFGTNKEVDQWETNRCFCAGFLKWTRCCRSSKKKRAQTDAGPVSELGPANGDDGARGDAGEDAHGV